MPRVEEQVIELALEAGFDLAGLAPLEPPPDAARFEAWLDAGHHAGLDYLERNRGRISDPRSLVPSGRATLLVLGLGHARGAVELEDGTRIARYAAGRDYHNLVGKQLKRLRRRLQEEGLIGEHARAIVDAGPLLERSHAAQAGLGFASKAANLLNPRFGPWLFLAELVLPVELEATPAAGADSAASCGTCTACLDACPTQALLEPGVLDANRCISFHTIENRGPVPAEIEEQSGPWAFGCDVCSEVCPWGRDAPDLAQRFGTHTVLEGASAAGWMAQREDEAWRADFEGSPLRRPGRAAFLRNTATVLSNRPSEVGRDALLEALARDASALVRSAAGRALGRAHGADAGVRLALELALAREHDDDARATLRAALEA